MSSTSTQTSFYRGENPLRADKLNMALSERVSRAGDTMVGSLLLAHDPIVFNEAATKQYVDASISSVVGSSVVRAFNGRTGFVTLSSKDVTDALTFTPYNATNPAGYITLAQASAGAPVQSVAGRTGAVVLTHVDITDWNATLSPYALSASPVFTGDPRAPTPAPADNDTSIATTAFVQAAIAGNTASVTSFNTRTGVVTLTTADVTAVADATYVNVSGDTMTGALALFGVSSAPTAAPGTNSTQIATTAFVQAAISGATAGVSSFNTRTGAVVLTSADVSGVGGWLLNSQNTGGKTGLDMAVPASAAAGWLFLGNLGGLDTPNLTSNVYYDSGASTWRNRSSGGGWLSSLGDPSVLTWYSVASGAANSAATRTYRMGLSGKGNLLLGVNEPVNMAVASATYGGIVQSWMTSSTIWMSYMYYDATNARRLNASDAPTQMQSLAGNFYFSGDVVGAADSVVSLTRRATITAKGNLMVGPLTEPASIVTANPTFGGHVRSWISSAENHALNMYYDGTNWRRFNATNIPAVMSANTGNWFLAGAAAGAVDSVVTLNTLLLVDTAGSMTLNGNLTAGGNVMAVTVRATGSSGMMSDSGIYGIGNNPAYYFSRNSSTGTWAFVANNVSLFYVDSSGNSYSKAGLFAANDGSFGLYQSGSNRFLQYLGNWYWIFDTTTGNLGWQSAAVGNQWYLRTDAWAYNAAGVVGGNGAYQNISDERQKHSIVPAEHGIDHIKRIKPIKFRRQGKGAQDKDEIGFSAQQLRDVIPEAVSVAGIELHDGTGGMDDPEPSLTVSIEPIVAALVNAMTAMDARMSALEARI